MIHSGARLNDVECLERAVGRLQRRRCRVARMHQACLFRQGHEQTRRGCIDATATLGAGHVGGEGERGKGSCAGGEVQARGEGGKDACAQDDAPFRQTDGKREVRGGLWEGWDIPHRST